MGIKILFSKGEKCYVEIIPTFKEDLKVEKKLKSSNFKGEIYSIYRIKYADEKGEIIFLGLGDRDKFNRERSFRSASFLVRKLKEFKIEEVFFPLKKVAKDENLLIEFLSGLYYGDYERGFFKSDKEGFEVKFHTDMKISSKILNISEKIGENVNNCRKLVDLPANHINPETFSEIVKKAFKGSRVKVKILGLKEIKDEGLNLIEAVSRGSYVEPKLLILNYSGNGRGKPIALIGKGVTFDSGGLNLKPTNHIEDMKTDMAGGGVVFSTIKLISELKEKVNVVGLIPLVENLPSKNPIKPGDVIISHSKKSVEILNTDAEGRLILADAISYSARYSPQIIVDVATLTGSAVIALGTIRSAILTKSNKLLEKIKNIGDEIGERVWPLPMDDEYGEELKSKIADIKNIGNSKFGGAILGGKFLENFAGETPFIHLDVAGTVYLKSDMQYSPEGATGFGVRLLYNFLKDLSQN